MILNPGCTLEIPGEYKIILGQKIRVFEHEASASHPGDTITTKSENCWIQQMKEHKPLGCKPN